MAWLKSRNLVFFKQQNSMDEEEDFEEGLAGAAERDEPIEDLDDIQVRNKNIEVLVWGEVSSSEFIINQTDFQNQLTSRFMHTIA